MGGYGRVLKMESNFLRYQTIQQDAGGTPEVRGGGCFSEDASQNEA